MDDTAPRDTTSVWHHVDVAAFHGVPPLPCPQPPIHSVRCVKLKWGVSLKKAVVIPLLHEVCEPRRDDVWRQGLNDMDHV